MFHLPIKTFLVALCVIALLVTSFFACQQSPKKKSDGEIPLSGQNNTLLTSYYAHQTKADGQGVIAPWYEGQNGQIDERIHTSINVIKRYPWIESVPVPGPYYLYTGLINMDKSGDIRIPVDKATPHNNGDLGQQTAYLLGAFVNFYQYSGDITVIPLLKLTAKRFLDHCLTSNSHSWPNFPISVPTKGEPFGSCDPNGRIQLDNAAFIGFQLLRAYQVTGEQEWFERAKHWGHVFYDNMKSEGAPWGRYANPNSVKWSNELTGSVSYIATFLNELLELGYTGDANEISIARDAAVDFIRSELLPNWASADDAWGRYFWDWEANVQADGPTAYTSHLMMDMKHDFPNWQNDVRNISTLMMNSTSPWMASRGDIYHGAWQYPESSRCCNRALNYGPFIQAWTFSRFSNETKSSWAREIARRMLIMSTYGFHINGYTEDLIDGGALVSKNWFKIFHPMAIYFLLESTQEMHEFAPARENHLLSSTRIPSQVTYEEKGVFYSFLQPSRQTTDKLILAFIPTRIEVDGERLPRSINLGANTYTTTTTEGGDTLLQIRHSGSEVSIFGNNISKVISADSANQVGQWESNETRGLVSSLKDDALEFEFHGNQFQIFGTTSPNGGSAEVFLDGRKLPTKIDFWSIEPRSGQVFSKSGLQNEKHTVTIKSLGMGNAHSNGIDISLSKLVYSSESSPWIYGEGEGPTITQSVVLGYDGRQNIVGADGTKWRPGNEWVIRMKRQADTFKAWWSTPASNYVTNSEIPEVYQYGVHGTDFKYNFTVGPGSYCVRLMFGTNRDEVAEMNEISVDIQGERKINYMDVLKSAGGSNKAVDVYFENIPSKNGAIVVRFMGGDPSTMDDPKEAFVQAIQISKSCDSNRGAAPIKTDGTSALL